MAKSIFAVVESVRGEALVQERLEDGTLVALYNADGENQDPAYHKEWTQRGGNFESFEDAQAALSALR